MPPPSPPRCASTASGMLVVGKRPVTDTRSTLAVWRRLAVDNPCRLSPSTKSDQRYCRRMIHGYARVSTAEQNPDHQIDALLRAGVTRENVHLDYASGAKASRPAVGHPVHARCCAAVTR